MSKRKLKETVIDHTKETNLGGFTLRKGKMEPGQCEQCAVFHDPTHPHNQESLYYQYHFREQHGRWPSWKDAMAHCTPEMQEFWINALKEKGIEV